MALHNELGKYGEELGKLFFTERQFNILYVNWKYSYYEIDIIASKDQVLHFVEVKTRKSDRFGLPEESVDGKKLKKLMNAAEAFLYKYPEWKRVQYDILSISFKAGNKPEFFFIEDVFL
ncbi:MAG: YraN family protein [Chitinophagaceae bacterium]